MNKGERARIDAKLKLGDKFNREISKLVRFADTKFSNNIEIDRLKRLIKIGKDTDPVLLIEECSINFTKFSEYINNENEDFFLQYEFEEEINDMNEEDHSFLNNIVKLFKSKFCEFSKAEKKEIWKLLKMMLEDVEQYEKINLKAS